jgi:hypothetical protein
MLNFVQAFLSHFFSYLGDKKRKIQTFILIGRCIEYILPLVNIEPSTLVVVDTEHIR